MSRFPPPYVPGPRLPVSPARPPLSRYLARLGYGTRREAERLVATGQVTSARGAVLRESDGFSHDDVRVHGVELDPPAGSVVMLHKPVGYVCSTSDRPPLVYELLPPRFLRREPVMATVGRLDAETSGLLLVTDDGPLNHQLTSPKWHLPKCYEVTLATPLRGDEAELFATGTLLLSGETAPVRPAQLDVLAPHRARLTISEGRYHQVRRMFAAVGNHVTALHRAAFGPLQLHDLAPGSWRVLTTAEVAHLREALRAAKDAR
ncbi:pseudouridine synthase [Gemmatimonas sp.]